MQPRACAPTDWLRAPCTGGAPADVGAPAGGGSLAAVQRRHIEQALRAAAGRIEGPDGAAAALGLSPSTLRSRTKEMDVRRGVFR